MSHKNVLTTESVGIGHPDKICDQIADAILDAHLEKDRNSKVACEVLISNKTIFLAGEITSTAEVDCKKIVWGILTNLNYNPLEFEIVQKFSKQSSEINQAVGNFDSEKIGAGDQGIVFGYATDEDLTDYLPVNYTIATSILKKLEQKIRTNSIKLCKFDMKSQVSSYWSNNKLIIDNILVSIQHYQDAKKRDIEQFVNKVIDEVCLEKSLDLNFLRIINPSGKFILGGSEADTGLTGRKIIVDTYGGIAKHGGGSFSGKDPTKIDRSGAYFARYIAKNLVAAKVAKKCEIQLGFAIGIPKAISLSIETFNTSKFSDEFIISKLNEIFNFEVSWFINHLNLFRPIYKQLSVYGHFGRSELDLNWEKLDQVEKIRRAFKL